MLQLYCHRGALDAIPGHILWLDRPINEVLVDADKGAVKITFFTLSKRYLRNLGFDAYIKGRNFLLLVSRPF